MLEYSSSIQKIIKDCETISGYACDVVFDKNIPTYSTVRMAGRNGLLRHQIIIKDSDALSDYYIAWQAVFIQRQFSADEENRPNISSSSEGFEEINKQLAILHPSMSTDELHQFTENILAGIITQLRSVPIGILVDMYLYREHESLREAQQKSLMKQVREYWAALNIDKSQFPEVIILANQHMNAAQAAMVDYQYPSPEIMTPYKLAGMEGISIQLLDICLTHNTGQVNDKEIIDQWASLLKIQNLYRWV